MKKGIYIENEGAIFRGFSRSIPKEVWDKKEGKFVPYKGAVPKPIEWGYVIGEAEAHRLMGVEEGKVEHDPAV